MSSDTIDTIIRFFPLLSAPLSLLLVVLLFFTTSTKYRLIYIVGIITALTIGVGWCSLISWALRDGLGPNAVESNGQLAWSRYMEPMQNVFIFAAFVVVSTVVALRHSIRKSK